MHIFVDLYDLEIDLENIKSFAEEFQLQQWRLSVRKCGIEETLSIFVGQSSLNDDSTLLSGELQPFLSQFEVDCNNEYIISAKRRDTNIEIVFDKFYSLTIESNVLVSTIFELMAKLHGFEACECSGFTVKNKEGEKIQPEEVLYIHNKFGVKFPKSITYFKHKLDDHVKIKQQENVSKSQFQVHCPSPILKSILNSTSLDFVSDKSFITLACIDSKYYLTVTNLEKVDLYSLDKQKTEELESWLKKHGNKCSKFLRKIYIDNNIGEYKKCKNLRKFVTKEANFLHKFLTIVPFFYDERDAITNKMIKTIKSILKTENMKIETDYLTIKRRQIIDRTPFFSLKAWEKD